MTLKPSLTTTFLLLVVLVVLLPAETYAFGAGDIPDFAYLNEKAFRHGDIESILENVIKFAGGASAGGGILEFAQSVLKQASGGSKFSRSDVKKVYFGNWLRDYSQAMDIAGLSKLTADTLVLIVSVLGFMTFGFATEEFEVTADRLGVYLPVEHIDNPKGYAEKEGDARQYHPKLRPPVDPRELEFDERTGMKNYMATEGQGWDTSTAFIRRTFRACIEHGRRSGGREGAELWEAYRLLGTGLHTMEDLLAHSNWCEVALRKMGHREVFCHVGENVIIDTPNGRAPPLVTGTFGGADFLHSLIGEAGDHLSQASVTDLSNKMNQASQDGSANSNVSALQGLLKKLPIGGNDDKANQSEDLRAKSKAYNFNPNDIAPPEVQRQLLELLKWRDDVLREILAKIDMIPGLSDLLEEFTNALNAYVYTILAPYLTPILTQATGVLDEGSKAVINTHDQYEVFDNPDASDPSHSMLSKDHFGLILNEPAGKIAQIVVEHATNLIVQAWSDNTNPDQVITMILEAFHHPYYASGRSEIQDKMFQHMEMWLGGLGSDEARQTLQALTKESVRDHKNKRLGSEDQSFEEPGYAKNYKSSNQYSSGGGAAHGGQGNRRGDYSSNYEGSTFAAQDPYSERRTGSGSQENRYGSSGYQSQENQYGGSRTGSAGQYNTSSYSSEGYESGRKQPESYKNEYGSNRDESSYGKSEYGREHGKRHHGGESRKQEYGSQYDDQGNIESSGTYGRSSESGGYGGESLRQEPYGVRRDDNEYDSSNKAYGRLGESESYGTGGYSGESRRQGYGSQRSEFENKSSTYGRSNESGSYDTGSYGGESRKQEYGSRRDDNNEYGGSTTSYARSSESGGYSTSGNYGREAEKEEGYGTKHSHRHGGEESSKYEPSYGRSEQRSYGEGEGRQRRGGEEYGSSGYSKSTSYGGQQEYPSFSQTEPEVKQHGDNEYSRGSGNEYGSSGYGSSGYGGDRSSGYTPNYDSRNETFGAERMKIRDSDDDSDHGKRSKKHGGHHRRDSNDS